MDQNRVYANEEIDPRFKTAVEELRTFLESYRKQCNAKSRYSDDDENKELLSNLCHGFADTMDRKVVRIENIANSLKLAHGNGQKYKQYYQTKLLPLILKSPINERAYTKPLGYAGDYEMIYMVHRDSFEGQSLFGKLLHKYSTSLPISRAVRKRTEYLTEKINSIVSQAKQHSVDILSIGSGPALEYKQLFEKYPLATNRISLTLLDQESLALRFSQDHMCENRIKYNSKIKIKHIHQKLEKYLFDYVARSYKKKYDLIYSTGLFDYLDYKVSRLMIKCLLQLLNTGGRLIIANCSLDSHNHRFFMEFGVDWYLIYRNFNDMLHLTEGIPKVEHYTIEEIEQGIIKFLEIKC